MDHRKVRKIYWICWLLASVIVVLGALLPDEKMQKIVIAIGIREYPKVCVNLQTDVR